MTKLIKLLIILFLLNIYNIQAQNFSAFKPDSTQKGFRFGLYYDYLGRECKFSFGTNILFYKPKAKFLFGIEYEKTNMKVVSAVYDYTNKFDVTLLYKIKRIKNLFPFVSMGINYHYYKYWVRPSWRETQFEPYTVKVNKKYSSSTIGLRYQSQNGMLVEFNTKIQNPNWQQGWQYPLFSVGAFDFYPSVKLGISLGPDSWFGKKHSNARVKDSSK
jgi:hypothetical protein